MQSELKCHDMGNMLFCFCPLLETTTCKKIYQRSETRQKVSISC